MSDVSSWGEEKKGREGKGYTSTMTETNPVTHEG